MTDKMTETYREQDFSPVPDSHPIVSLLPRYSGEVELFRCSRQVLVRFIVFKRAQFDRPITRVVVRIDNVVAFRLQ